MTDGVLSNRSVQTDINGIASVKFTIDSAHLTESSTTVTATCPDIDGKSVDFKINIKP